MALTTRGSVHVVWRWSGIALATALTVVACGGATSAPQAQAAPRHTKVDTEAHEFNGTPTIGALFFPDLPGAHFCTASVVRSPGHNVIMTAAHCLQPQNGSGYTFTPGSHDTATPYGSWTTTAAYASPNWIKHDGNTKRDFVFLTVAPQQVKGTMRNIQDVVGANRLGLRAKKNQIVRITGYPMGVGGKPVTCVTKIYLHRGYPATNCSGFGDGTSGGPWLAGHGKIRTVVGLIAGLHQGGCTEATTYSTLLGKPARAALHRAEHHQHPDTMPSRPSDGCPSGL